jgi:predicted nucleotidyltransferase
MNGHDPRYIEYPGEVLRESIDLIDSMGLAYLGFGGMAKSYYGEPQELRDIDILIREEDADELAGEFARHGYRVDKDEHDWLYKAYKHEVMIDLIFHVEDRIELDEQMLERATDASLEGTKVRLIGPEDHVLTLALSNKSDTSYWYDALEISRKTTLDWHYLAERSRAFPERVAAFLLYARADGIDIPIETTRRVVELALQR